MSKDTFYFQHDDNATSDPKIIKLIRSHGYEAYGLFWAIVEKLYSQNGRIPNDPESIAWDLHVDPSKIIPVLKSDLFFSRGGMIGSESVDRRIAKRKAAIEFSRNAGRASWLARGSGTKPNGRSTGVQRAFNGRSTGVEPKRKKERKKERNKEITTAPNTPSAVDLKNLFQRPELDKSVEKFFSEQENALDRRCAIRGEHYGRKFIDIPFDYAASALEAPSLSRIGAAQRAGFKARVDLKISESNIK